MVARHLLAVLLTLTLFLSTCFGIDREWVKQNGLPSICRVRTPTGLGTGCYLGAGMVLTAKHVAGAYAGTPQRVTCEFKYEERKGWQITNNKYVDQSIIILDKIPADVPMQKISNWMPPGSKVFMAGFDNADPDDLRIFSGTVSAVRVDYGDFVNINPDDGQYKAVSGNSGGPVWSEDGAIVSCVTHANFNGQSAFPNSQHLVHFLNRMGIAEVPNVAVQQDL